MSRTMRCPWFNAVCRVAAVNLLVVLVTCSGEHTAGPPIPPSTSAHRVNNAATGSATSAPVALRPVRVLIAAGVPAVRLRCPVAVSISTDQGTVIAAIAAEVEFEVAAQPGVGIRIAEDYTSSEPVSIVAAGESWLSYTVLQNGEWSAERRYSGSLRVMPAAGSLLDVVNHVDVETYVAGVVAGEIWPTFDVETYRAQSIVARTFVLYEMIDSQRSAYDVTATQGSQVYRGLRDDPVGRRASDATASTRGVVATWNDGSRERIFCTYYSAACGGCSQSAAIFGPESDVPPLAGNVPCDYCKIAPAQTYRWAPARIRQRDLLGKLGARTPEWLSAGDLQSIEPTQRTPDGRIVQLRLTSTNGYMQDWLAERFRLLVGGALMRSTHCDIRISGEDVIFENGRGFGHGLGLCQWGAEGQAREGRQAGEMIRYYYPGARLSRAY